MLSFAQATGALDKLIDRDQDFRLLGTGFGFTEGPAWNTPGNYLMFSDIPGDRRWRWSEQRGMELDAWPTYKGNGMAYEPDGSLLVCEQVTSSLIRIRPDGLRQVVACHYQGKYLNSPNDVCVHSSGAIYFSDPWYGRMPVYGVERPRQLGFQGVYRLAPGGGEPKLLVDRYLFDQPNGLCFSPDERQLYVNDTTQALIRVFEVEDDGSISNPRVFASGIRSELEPGVPDGMKCDQRGNVWVTAPGGVANSSSPTPKLTDGELRLDPQRCAMIIQDLQNDVIMDGGAFAESGAPAHAQQQRVVDNVRRLAEVARGRGVVIIHVWFIVEPGAPGVTLNAPLFEGLVDSKAMVRGSWGAAPVSGLEPRAGDFIVEKMRMSAWEGTRLETILKATGRDMIINTGAWTNMSVEHTARTGADKGFFIVVPEDCCSTMNADWHNASINFALQNVSVVTNADTVIKALG